MTISPLYTVWCDAETHSPGCVEHHPSERMTRAEAWKAAKSDRWVRYQTNGTGYVHFSPQCDPSPRSR